VGIVSREHHEHHSERQYDVREGRWEDGLEREYIGEVRRVFEFEFEGLFLLEYKDTLKLLGTLGVRDQKRVTVCVRKGTGTVEDVEKGQIVGFGVVRAHE